MPQIEHGENSNLSGPLSPTRRTWTHKAAAAGNQPRRPGGGTKNTTITAGREREGRERGDGAEEIASENADASLTLNGVKAAIKRMPANPQAADGEKGEPAKRRRAQRTAEKVGRLRVLLAGTPSATLSQIRSYVGLSRTATQRVIKSDLQLKSLQQVKIAWVPLGREPQAEVPRSMRRVAGEDEPFLRA